MNIKRIAGNKKPDGHAIARNPAGSLDEQWAAMNAALERLGLAKPQPVLRSLGVGGPAHPGGRLIVALDLTASRAESLIRARIATTQMFAAIKAVGKVAVKMLYFRGDECRATAWHDDAEKITGAMLSLSCKTGTTQICRVLKLALAEKEKLSGVVLVGDHSEDNPDELLHLAATLGWRSIPLFIFHEVVDHDHHALQARPVFKQMAKLSGGVYSEFRPDSGDVLRELLSTVAAFSVAGHEGVKQIAQPVTAPARQLKSSLLMLAAPEANSNGR